MNLHIENKSALLCGASKGLGRACADRLAAAGARLYLTARDEAALEQACRDIRATHGVEVTGIRGDLSKADDRAAFLARCPQPDILVLGGGWPDVTVPHEQWTTALWMDALNQMMVSQIDMMSRVVPGMVGRGHGRIVAITSRLIKDPELALAMPAAARLGLTGYVKALSREVAAHDVTVNTILPGIFATETQVAHTQALSRAGDLPEHEIVRQRTLTTPARRFGTPMEFSSLCAYLCSRDAGFLTGQAIVMDGGAHTGIW